MSAQTGYNRIDKYVVQASLKDPLHVGTGETTEKTVSILIHPVTGEPFIQASSINGAIREYVAQNYKNDEKPIFEEGRFVVTDAQMISKNSDSSAKIELRPRVSINPETGSVLDNATINGKKSGAKFDMEYVGEGALIEFRLYLYTDSSNAEAYNKILKEVLSAIHKGVIKFGGQKSNGCGRLEISSIKQFSYDMTKEKHRESWIDEAEDIIDSEILTEIEPSLLSEVTSNLAYRIHLRAATEGEAQVRSIGVTTEISGNPDSQNIMNANSKFIVPGSSLKGTIRNQMEKIAHYIYKEDANKADKLIHYSFGNASNSNEAGNVGVLYFHDCIIGEKADAHTKARIHIDKFTGSVMYGGLFSESNTKGDNLDFEIEIRNDVHNQKEINACMAVLLMALRDLAIGIINIGNGYNVGKGFLKNSKFSIERIKDGKKAEIDVDNNVVNDRDGIIDTIMMALE